MALGKDEALGVMLVRVRDPTSGDEPRQKSKGVPLAQQKCLRIVQPGSGRQRIEPWQNHSFNIFTHAILSRVLGAVGFGSLPWRSVAQSSEFRALDIDLCPS